MNRRAKQLPMRSQYRPVDTGGVEAKEAQAVVEAWQQLRRAQSDLSELNGRATIDPVTGRAAMRIFKALNAAALQLSTLRCVRRHRHDVGG